ncbi:putative Adenylate/guanylate cyclase domain-containing protein [Gammaproteobacteria bacterium]
MNESLPAVNRIADTAVDASIDIAAYFPLYRPSPPNALKFDPGAAPIPVVRTGPAAVLMTDIVGFTPLTERLARQGALGAEGIGTLINQFFSTLTELVHIHGGDVATFAGDGLVAVWPAGEENLATVVLRATQCAMAVRSTLDGYPTDAGNLRLHTALGGGELAVLRLGGRQGRWRLLYTGPALVQAAAANRRAGAGEVVLSREAWDLVQDQVKGYLDGEVAWLDDMGHSVASCPLVVPSLSEMEAAFLSHCLIGPVAAWGDQTHWLAELRTVTALFVGLPPYPDADALPTAQAATERLQQAVDSLEGDLLDLLADDRGTTAVVAFGLPPHAHEDDALRAVQAALACREALAALKIKTPVGIATGRVFCGVIGGKGRRTYTLLGDTVNVAARLRQGGTAEVLCDTATQAALGGRICCEALPSIQVRGHQAPVAVWRPEGRRRRRTPARDNPLVGRASELCWIEAALETLHREGRGAVVVIEGEAGIGKSRLVGRFMEQARERRLSVLFGAADAIDRGTAYFPWRGVLTTLLGLDSIQDDPAAQSVRILAGLPNELQPAAPLLAAILPLDLPDTPHTRPMIGEVRAVNTRALLIALLVRHIQTHGPTVLVLEDVHWLDSASWAVTLQVVHEVPGLLLAATARPPSEPVEEYRRLLALAVEDTLRLEGLPRADAIALACRCLGVESLPPVIADLIDDKARGHPFFTEELVYALRDAGVIRIEAGQVHINPRTTTGTEPAISDLHALGLPDTLQGLVTSRIDRLSPGQQLALKVASVIGRAFAYSLLCDIYPVTPERHHLSDYLDTLRRLDLTTLHQPAPGLAYVFKHLITQEVAYNLLLYAQRRELHAAVARWYEQTWSADFSVPYQILAHHWRAAEVYPKAVDYLEQAAEQAQVRHANREAVDFYHQAMALVGQGGHDLVEPLRWARWRIGQAMAWWGLGQLDECRSGLKEGLSALDLPVPESRVGLLAGAARQMARQGVRRLRRSHWLRRPSSAAGESDEQARLLMNAYEHLSQWAYFAHAPETLLYAVLHATDVAEDSGTITDRARSYAALAVVASLIPSVTWLARSYARKAREALAGVEDVHHRAHVLKLLCICDLKDGHWGRTATALTEVMEIALRLGDGRLRDENLAQHFESAYFQGDYTGGLDRAEELLRLARVRGDVQAQTWALCGVTMNHLRQGNIAAAAEAVRVVRALPRKEVQILEEIWGTGLAALVALRREEWSVALAEVRRLDTALGNPASATSLGALEAYAGAAEVSLALWARRLGNRALHACARRACRRLAAFARRFPIATPRAWLWEGRRLQLAERSYAARRALETGLVAARKLTMPYEEALAHALLARLPSSEEECESHRSRAATLFERLGCVVELAEVRAEGRKML